MSVSLQINGKNLQPIKDVVGTVSYSRDYITRLAREEKIVASLVGRQWFIDVQSLKNYEVASAMEQDLRKKLLSEQRKQERLLKDDVDSRTAAYVKSSSSLHYRAAAVSCLVLGFGLLGGWATNFLTTPYAVSTAGTTNNTAQVSASAQAEVQPPAAVEALRLAEVSPQPASTNRAPALVPEFSNPEVTPIDNIESGILLLPQSTTTPVAEFFSDEVRVKQLPEGGQAVVQVDEFGNETGNEIPFVVIPAASSSVLYE